MELICEYCGKKIQAISEKQAKFFLQQHHLGKHSDLFEITKKNNGENNGR